MYYPRFTKVIIHYFLTQDKTISWRNKIGMHTSRDDYLINTLRFVSAKEATQIYGVVLPKSLTSPEMKEIKDCKTYLGFATGATPPKKARKFKKPASPQLTIVPVSPEEPTRKSKRVKRPAKKSTKALARTVVIRETSKMPLSKKKEKMTLEKRKGIDLLFEVALTEEAQYEEARQKSLKDFHKTHPSGSGTVTKTAPSAAKIKPSVTNEGIGVKPGYHNLWDVIVNGDLEEEHAPTTGETSVPPAPKTSKQQAARSNQERVKSILLLAILDEYLLKFHNVADAKSLWEAIKSRFGGNVESKKMQKNVLKHQFEIFSTASNESLDKAYDRFQKLISQLEIALIMRNKPDINEIDIDDLYNNLRVDEDELKRSSGSNPASQNLAFLSSENTGSTNKVSAASGDFRMDVDDLEELDLRGQVAILTVRVKKFIQRTGRNMDFKEKRPISLDKSKI
ncbi:hypothetical protein Tco_0408033, partial [Tanacetum coccineum]